MSAGGTTWFRGKVNEPANVTLNGKNARVYADGTFEALTEVGAGVQDVAVQATDKAGNVTSETWRVDNGSASGAVPTHDLEGNLLTDGHYTYTWDARNRMTSVTVGSDTWTFTYDGQNRRIAESKNSTPVREWIWDGTRVMEERLADGTKHRLWTGGIEILSSSNQQTGKRFTVTDHLGSTRVVADGTSGTVSASYDYAPWGQRTRISGAEDYWGTGYTGHWWHESGLSLAVFRPYDPRTGRWPSRDPIEEKGGLNIYQYVFNGPVIASDELGLDIYLRSGNAAAPWWQPGNRQLHQEVCVDRWKKCCPENPGSSIKDERKVCWSFGFTNFGWTAPSMTWLGRPSFNAGGPMKGEVYRTADTGLHTIKTKKTTCSEDLKFWFKMWLMEGRVDTYSVARHNCRMFSQMMYNEGP